MEIVFATNNPHKLEEVRSAVNERYIIFGLKEKGINEEIPENLDTLEGNASEKAMFIYNKYGISCFADDTGLEVEALDNRPGVLSARFAGPQCYNEDNIDKLLGELKGIANRKAVFRTVIALVELGKLHIFEGSIEGSITHERKGSGGFGYDAVFHPSGHDQTFAEMSMSEKNKVSHRALAVRKLIDFLDSYEL